MEARTMTIGAKCLVGLLVVGAVLYVTAGPVSDDVTSEERRYAGETGESGEIWERVDRELDAAERDNDVERDVAVDEMEAYDTGEADYVDEEEEEETNLDAGDGDEKDVEEEDLVDDDDNGTPLAPASEDMELDDVTEPGPVVDADVISDPDEDQSIEVKEERKKKRKRGNKKRKGKGKKRKGLKAKRLRQAALADAMTDEMLEETIPEATSPTEMLDDPSSTEMLDYPSNSTEMLDYPSNSTEMLADSPRRSRLSALGLTSRSMLSLDTINKFFRGCTNTQCYDVMPKTDNLCPMHDPAIELRKWAHELESALSHGCCCRGKENCGGQEGKCCGSCCLRREEPFESAVVRITQMLKDFFYEIQKNCECGPKDDPMCDPWTQWSRCSKTCDLGKETRTRVCPPGMTAVRVQTRKCNIQPCRTCTPQHAEWTSWGVWSSCPVTCGQGAVSRSRTCDVSVVSCGGRSRCFGNPRESKVITCGDVGESTWASWGMWSSCTTSCGDGIVHRTRRCNRSPCGNNRCFGNHRETKEVRCGPDVGVATWASWGMWSSCTTSCGEGTVYRTRRCNPSPCGNDRCFGDHRETKLVRCGDDVGVSTWASWGSWSSCSTSCGDGIVHRSRRCNPSPCGSGTCFGQDRDTKVVRCGDDGEANWASWGPWSSCATSCGEGTVYRTRRCNPSPCGNDRCFGDHRESRVVECGPDVGVSTWASWGLWSSCTTSCGQGQVYRERRCDRSPCGDDRCFGDRRETRMVECGPIGESEWEIWGEWSSCVDKCGQETVKRRRVCNRSPCGGSRCFGDRTDTKVIRCGPDRTVGVYEPWSSWSPCSSSCGRGFTERRRRCNNLFSLHCSTPCRGKDTDRRECGVDQPTSEWTSWSQWSDCLSLCGEETVRRSRSCNTGPCGGVCRGGDSFDTKVVRCGPPAIDAMWGQWGPWSQCQVSCGEGVVRRLRQCDESTMTSCGRTCTGGRDTDIKTIRCGPEMELSSWQSWSMWSDCLDMCGEETVTRTRRCNIGACGGDRCFGETFDSKVVRCGPERVDGQWENWGSWGQCSSSCGMGRRERMRRCSVLAANQCQRECRGRDVDSQVCGTDYPESTWMSWSSWSECTATCGRQTVQRSRRCNFNPCGGRCRGDEVDTREIQCGPDREDGTWQSWGQWSQCSKTCGIGRIERRRQCSVAFPTDCQRGCRGRPTEHRRCGMIQADGVWSSWSQWSSCSRTCGGGERTRRRTCQNVNECGRPCPGSDIDYDNRCGTERCTTFRYMEWAKWCPCDCTTGNTTRQRHCHQVFPDGTTRRTSLANCHVYGVGREEEFCVNVPGVDECELCITNCNGKYDGKYQSCTGCKDYIVCENNRISELKTCETGSFSAFDGGCSMSAKSCGVKEPIKSCAGLPDGKYPSEDPGYFYECSTRTKKPRKRRCTQNDRFVYKVRNHGIMRPGIRELEYNHQLRACENFRSPTCVRDLDPRSGPIPLRTVDRSFMNDAPADNDDNLTGNLTEEKMDELKKFKDWIKENTGEKEVKPRRMNRKCITTCLDVTDGMYGSCRGCRVFAQCTDGYLRETRCPDDKEFDTKERKCVKRSPTCELRGQHGWLD